MNAKARIKRAESALSSAGGVKLIWVEPDENGNFPPAPPGSQTITIKWDTNDNPDQDEILPPASE
jgi:hypothetical protein